MEVEQILSTLEEKLGETSFSKQTLQKYVELNPVEGDSDPDESYWNKAVELLKGMQGQFNHDVAAQVNDFKKNYKPGKDTGGQGAGNEELEKIKKELEELRGQKEKEDAEKEQAKLRKKVREGLKDNMATDEYVLGKVLDGASFDSGKSVEELVKEFLPKYDAEYKSCRGNGAPPRDTRGKGGNTESAASKYFERKGKKEGWRK